MVHKQILAGASLETGIPPNKVEKLRLRECKWLAQGHSEQRWGGGLSPFGCGPWEGGREESLRSSDTVKDPSQ